MIYVKVNDKLYPARVDGRVSDRDWDGRESCFITIAMPYEEAAELFADNTKWSTVYQGKSYTDENGEIVTPDPVERDCSEFCIAGDITDHRDGTMTVKMGKLTELEETLVIIYGGVE